MPRPAAKKKAVEATVEVVEEVAPSKKPRLTLTVRKRLTLSLANYCPTEPCDVLLTCGNGDVGQLACGESKNGDERCPLPRRVTKLAPPVERFLQVAAGSFHTVVLTADNQVYTSGCSDDCALGRDCWNDNGASKRIDDQDFVLRPVEALNNYVDQHGPVVQISAGDSHTAALTAKGSVLVWGTFRDKQGPLGLTTAENSPSSTSASTASARQSKSGASAKGGFVAKSAKPTLVSTFHQRQIVKIVSGFNHLIMLASDGVLFTLGAGDAGQLGRLAPQFRDSSVSDRTKSRMLIPQAVAPENSRSRVYFTDVWCAGYCCFAKATDNSVYVWGLNNYYQLGYVPNDSDQTMVFYPVKSEQFKSDCKWKSFSGDHHIVALDDQNNVYTIGRGDDSRLGTGSDKEQQTLIQLESLKGQVSGVAAGNSCSFVWRNDGKALVWGCDMEGEMGLGLEENETVKTPTQLKADSLRNIHIRQISVGGQHTVFLGTSSRT